MKYTLYLILSLALASLACLETSTIPQSAPTAASTPPSPKATLEAEEPYSGAVYELAAVSPETAMHDRCAIVTAIEALHLRAEPSEKARVIGWLRHGQAVTVQLKQSDWWLITSGQLTGYARSAYLTESECK